MKQQNQLLIQAPIGFSKFKPEKESFLEFQNISLTYDYELRDKTGLLIFKSKIVPCASWVLGFPKIMFNTVFFLSFGSPTAVVDTGGTSRTDPSQMGIKVDAGTTVSAFGIQVGTGTNAVAMSDTKLQTQIAHGTSAGQLQYGATTFGAPSVAGGTTTFRVTRVFTNGSAGSITANELGMVSRYNTSSTPNFMIIRDIFSPGVAIGVGEAMTLNYNINTAI